MTSFVIMEPSGESASQRTAAFRLVRDRFSCVAFLLPFVWLLAHRLWIETALALAVVAGLAVLFSIDGFGLSATLLYFLLGLLVALEGPSLEIAALSRRGWIEWGALEARTCNDAELRYLGETVMDDEAAAPQRPALPAGFGRQRSSAPALGLFSYPGR